MQSTVTNFTYAAADLAAGAMSNPVFRPDLHDGAVAVLEGLLENEPEERVALEAAGSAAALGSRLGEERISAVLWDDRRSDLSMGTAAENPPLIAKRCALLGALDMA